MSGLGPQGGAASGLAKPVPRQPLDSPGSCVTQLESLFERIAATRMAGTGLLHPRLRVQAVGFEAEPDGDAAFGILITPWFMNLVRLPLGDGADGFAAPFSRETRSVGVHRIEFIGADEPPFGRFEACSLFSPMNEFADQAGAVALALQVLEQLRQVPPSVAQPARRGFLLGSAGVAR